METRTNMASCHRKLNLRKREAFDISDSVMSFQNGIFASLHLTLDPTSGPENQWRQRLNAVFYLWLALPVFAGL